MHTPITLGVTIVKFHGFVVNPEPSRSPMECVVYVSYAHETSSRVSERRFSSSIQPEKRMSIVAVCPCWYHRPIHLFADVPLA